MAESKEGKKEPQPGKLGRTQILQKLDSVMQRVVSYLSLKTNSKRVIFKPDNKRFGNVMYRVQWEGVGTLFTKLTDARAFKRLLKQGKQFNEPVIIRTDTTDEGYIVSERKIK